MFFRRQNVTVGKRRRKWLTLSLAESRIKLNSKVLRRVIVVVICFSALTPDAFAFDPLLPDTRLTPGKVAKRPADTRGVPASTEEEVFARYRIPLERRSFYEIDHLIPRELGGADDIRNLWPQRLSARPYGPRRKRLLTQRLIEMIAAKQITLAEAQREMSEDWISAFVAHIGMVYLSPNAQPMPSD
jgi:hypothetical protein